MFDWSIFQRKSVSFYISAASLKIGWSLSGMRTLLPFTNFYHLWLCVLILQLFVSQTPLSLLKCVWCFCSQCLFTRCQPKGAATVQISYCSFLPDFKWFLGTWQIHRKQDRLPPYRSIPHSLYNIIVNSSLFFFYLHLSFGKHLCFYCQKFSVYEMCLKNIERNCVITMPPQNEQRSPELNSSAVRSGKPSLG